jgi:hypothetical protein
MVREESVGYTKLLAGANCRLRHPLSEVVKMHLGSRREWEALCVMNAREQDVFKVGETERLLNFSRPGIRKCVSSIKTRSVCGPALQFPLTHGVDSQYSGQLRRPMQRMWPSTSCACRAVPKLLKTRTEALSKLTSS